MKFLRDHWFDLGGGLALLTGVWLALQFNTLSEYRVLMYGSLISLFLHQLEEYRIVGTFPGMINEVLYRSSLPERYPLNPQTSLVINVGIGWTTYLLAALFAERAVWLGLATILVSAGNVIAHTILFNVKGRTFYNAGMATAVLLFLPVVIWFFTLVARPGMAGPGDYIAGFILGVVLNVVGVLKMIEWMADRDSPFAFSSRQMLRRGGGPEPER
jgi:hypothetical protein